MPGNEVGDRVHNFFAEEDLSHGQHHSQVADGNWALPNNYNWVGSQSQTDVRSSKLKDYSQHQSDLVRAHNIQSQQVQHGLNSMPPARPELTKSLFHNQHPDSNGNIYGHTVFQTISGEANRSGVDSESDQNNSIGRGLSVYEQSQHRGPNNPAASVRLNSFEPPVSYDFFGGQPQMSDHPGIQQSFPQQQSGFSDMQQLQQQLMIRKMEELQRQKDFHQLHARQQNSVKQMSSFVGQVSGNYSHDVINGAPVTEASQPWATKLPAGNTNWLQRASSAVQGSSSGLMFSPQQGQLSQSLNLINQQVDHSLPGVPISISRDNSKQYHYIAKEKSLQKLATDNNSFQGNQYSAFREHASMQDEHVIGRQGFQGEKLFGHTSHQGLNSRLNMENFEQQNPLEKDVATQEFHWKQEIVGPSEMLQDKIIAQTASQNSVALDPTEEKILFGSDDDSVWDAFGKNTITNGGVSNLFDTPEFVDGLPSIQSGSWSALMQSAVAETSSSDAALREDWTNLSFQNPDRPTNKHQSSTYDTDKRHTPLVDKSSQISSAFTFGSVPISHDVNQKNSYHSGQGLLQFGQKVSGGYVGGMQNNSSHRPIQQSSARGSNWLNSGSQNNGTASPSVDAYMNGKGDSSHWTPQQNGSSQPSKLHSWAVTKGMTPGADTTLDIHENEKYMQNSENNGQKMVTHELLNHKDDIWKDNSVSNTTVDLEQLRSSIAYPQEGSCLNSNAARLNSSKLWVSEEASYRNSWKPIEVSVKTKESEHSRKEEHLLNKGNQLVQSPFRSSEEDVKMHETGSSNRKENHKDSYLSSLSDHKFTAGSRGNDLSDSSDSQSVAGGKQKSSNQVGRKSAGPRKFQYHPMGNLDEDFDPSYQMKQVNHSKLMPLHNSQGFKSQDTGFFGQSKFFGQIPKDSTDKGKGQLPDRQGDTTRLNEVSSTGSLPGYGLDLSSDLNRSFGMSRVNMASHSSENMLELLHKVDQPEERSSAMRISTGYSTLSQTPEVENSDGIVGSLRQNQSSASQGFTLQLAPPSQKGPGLNHVSANPSQTVKYSSSYQATGDGGNEGQKMLDSTTLCQSSFPSEVCRGEFKNNRNVIPGQTASDASLHKMHEKISSGSGFLYLRSDLHNQPMSKSSGQVLVDSRSRLGSQSTGNSVYDAVGSAPHSEAASSINISRRTPMDHPHDRVSAAQISAGEGSSVSQTVSTTGISQKGAFPNMFSNIGSKVPAQQLYIGSQDRRGQPKNFQSHQLGIVESTVFAPKNLEGQPKLMDNFLSDLGVGSLHPQGFVCGNEQLGKEDACQQVSSGNKDLGQKINKSLQKEPVLQQISCAPSLNPPSTKRDIEAFGRSLKPNNFIQQNFSLQNQIKAMKNMETDPSNRDMERVKGPNNILLSEKVASKSGQQYEGGAMVEGSPPSCSVSSVDPKTCCFPEPVDYGGINASSRNKKVPSQEMFAFDQNKSESFQHGSCTVSVRTEHSNISPQMAPSWFSQYGNFKNGQILQAYDARKSVALNTTEQPFMHGQSLNNFHMQTSVDHVNIVADPNQISNKLQNTPLALLEVEHCSSPQLLQPDSACERLVVSMPKKRKCTTFEPQSWQKEVSEGSTDLHSLRVAEAKWATATSRLREKVEDDFDTEYGFGMPRARRRLTSTKQLMQLLFPAPSAVILSAEASLNYETVSYFAARLTLGDACSLMSYPRSHSDPPSDAANLQADKRKTSDRNCEQHNSQVMEDFTGRVRKLETDLLRLEKNPSLLDLRLEVQDIEKISTVNRFAMFHSRLQTDGAETSSLPGAAVGSQKPLPQRYVTAVTLPRNLPDRVQCLPL